MELTILPGQWMVCRLTADAPVPEWALRGLLWSVTRTPEELSIVAEAAYVPAGVTAEGPWAAFKVRGPLDFSLTGILAALAVPLADAGVSLFALSTYDTDYVLVPAARLEDATAALTGAGHSVQRPL